MKDLIANSLRMGGIVCVLCAAASFGAAALNPALAEHEVEILDEPIPVVELIGHGAGIAGIAAIEGGKKLGGGPPTPPSA